MRRILIIDDNPDVLRLTARMVEAAGYVCISHASAEAGLDALDHEAVDAVITDIRMPGMNGSELILHLKAGFPDLPVIAMSGGGLSNGEEALTYARRLGATAVLAKPFRATDLAAVLKSVLDGGATRLS